MWFSILCHINSGGGTKMKRVNDTPHRRVFEKFHGRKIRPGYHIHHIDGDHTNNDPSNLIEVTTYEHYLIHKEQGDWAACMLLADASMISPDELAEIQHMHGKSCADRGVGIHSDEFDHSSRSRMMWEQSPPGRKPVTNGVRVLKLKTDGEVDNFLERNPGWRRGIPENMKRGLRQSTRRITSDESKELSKKRLAEGNHNFTQQHTCPHCGMVGKGPMMKRWHFDKCKTKVVL